MNNADNFYRPFYRTIDRYPDTDESISYHKMNDFREWKLESDWNLIQTLIHWVGLDLEEARKGWHFTKREQQ